MMRLVLASSSPYRQALLARLRLEAEAISPNIDESRHAGETVEAYVCRLSVEKAKAVRAMDCGAPPTLYIGSDQTAVLDGRFLGKPGNVAANVEQLRAASGRTVTFFTGLAVVGPHSEVVDVVSFRVVFRELTVAEIERYVEAESPLDCAGGFKAEGLGVSLFERMEGDDPTALIGLPLIRLSARLRELGVAVP